MAKLGAGSRGPWTRCWARGLSRVAEGVAIGGTKRDEGTNVGRNGVAGQVRNGG